MRIATIDRDAAGPPPNAAWFPGGPVRMQAINNPETDGVQMLSVWFDAGARTRPHIHVCDQILHVVEGEGVVATADEKRIIRVGDVVIVPEGVWHWHGATPDSAMCHLSIKPPGPTDWDQPFEDWDAYMEGAS